MAALSANSGVVSRAAAVPGVKAIETVLSAHYRDALKDSKVNYSAAWQDARVSIRFLNHMSPLILGVIQRQTGADDIESRKQALAYLATSTATLSKIMAERLAPNQQVKHYDQVELNNVLTHLVGRLWAQSQQSDPQKSVDDLLRTVAALYADPEFLGRHKAIADMMMAFTSYQRVDSQETMENRMRMSMHQATMRFYEATVDERIGNGKEVYFSYGLKRTEVVALMLETFDKVTAEAFAGVRFAELLTNDQRTAIMQTWLRTASDVFRAEYVARTIRIMDWFREDSASFRARFEKAKTMLPDVLQAAAATTTETMQDLIVVSNNQCLGEQEPATSPAPR